MAKNERIASTEPIAIFKGKEVVTFCHGLKLPATDGKLRETDCANTEGFFRITSSSPSPKAE